MTAYDLRKKERKRKTNKIILLRKRGTSTVRHYRMTTSVGGRNKLKGIKKKSHSFEEEEGEALRDNSDHSFAKNEEKNDKR